MKRFLDDNRPDMLFGIAVERYKRASSEEVFVMDYSQKGNFDNCDDPTWGAPYGLRERVKRVLNVKRPVRVLDICCGAGAHLASLHNQFGSDIEIVGVTAPIPKHVTEDLRPNLKQALAQLDIRVDNADFLYRILKDEKPFDISISRYGIAWLADPLGALQRMIAATESSGYVFAYPFMFPVSDCLTKGGRFASESKKNGIADILCDLTMEEYLARLLIFSKTVGDLPDDLFDRFSYTNDLGGMKIDTPITPFTLYQRSNQ